MNTNDSKDEYKFPVSNERTKDFIRALQSGDKKIIDLAYLALSPGEKIKYKMILTQARKRYYKEKQDAKVEIKNLIER